MPSIEKLQSGFIYQEDFSTDNVMWQIFPNDASRYTRISNSLILKQGDSRIIAIASAPDDDFTLQCKITHQPLSENSFAGVLLLKDNDDWVECQLYKDPDATTQVYYNYIKVVKIGYNYYFYASKDNITWIVVGAMAYDDCHYIGFYFESDVLNEQVTVEKVMMYKTPVVSVIGNKAGDVVQIIDGSNNIIATKTAVIDEVAFDLTQKALPLSNCKVKRISSGTPISSALMTINGGDVFGIKYNLKLKVNGTVVDPNALFDLGRITPGIDHVLTVENMDAGYIIANLKISIQQYSPYDYGYQNVSLMFYNHEDTDTYSDSLNLTELDYGTPVDILMKIDRETDIAALFKTSGFRYKIIIE